MTAEREALEKIQKIDSKHELNLDDCRKSRRQPDSLDCTFLIRPSLPKESFALGIVMDSEWDGLYFHTTVWAYDVGN